ncbi:hypothetical protein B0G83_101964 [Paraburkholderia sp. BL21I4N1]|nr:hypothetical protein B0G83_101964 [Paraburkholderia sp. BL21I4N1]
MTNRKGEVCGGTGIRGELAAIGARAMRSAKRVAGTPLVCVGSRRYFEQYGMPKRPPNSSIAIRYQMEQEHAIFGGVRFRMLSVPRLALAGIPERIGIAPPIRQPS